MLSATASDFFLYFIIIIIIIIINGWVSYVSAESHIY